jgi:hypothetical protein
MRMLAELEELGMQLARATAARALADLTEPEPQPEIPHAAPLAAEQAHNTAPAATRPPGATTARKIDPALLFIRLAAAIRELIALEAGLAAGPAAKTGLLPPALRADPRREILLKAFREVTEHKQDRSAARYEFARLMDEELTADPEQILGLPEIFYPICMSLGIELDVSKLSDEIIGMDPPDDARHRLQRPNPRATSPP